VLPVRVACNLRCPFCFSKSSVSALKHERTDWRRLDVARYYEFAKDRGATRLVITGGGEPLLRPDDVRHLIELGRRYFDEVACFTNGTFLTRELANQLRDAGLSYVCYSRHAADDDANRGLMGEGAPRLGEFFDAVGALKVRATCVMVRGSVEDAAGVWEYIDALRPFGVREFTFKHTYVAYAGSLFQNSEQNEWAREHKVEFDPFGNEGEVIARLPWGPRVRRIRGVQACYYHEPTPQWEREHRTCRSSNLLSDGSVFASLEDASSLLFRLGRS
jgi:cyclic pyranopterin phosphate synthase